MSWIYTDTYVGWVPLAPYEPYYCHNYWGPSVIIVGDFDDDHHHGGHHDDNHGRHHYEDHAVVVNQNNFYKANNYNDVRIRNVDRATIAKTYRGSPVVNSMVIKNHKDLLQKYNFADLNVRQKPHQTVRERIQQNLAAVKRGDRQNASAIAQKLDRMQPGKPVDGSLMKGRPMQVTDKMVPDRDVNKPKARTPFATRELKPSGQVRPEQHEAKEPCVKSRLLILTGAGLNAKDWMRSKNPIRAVQNPGCQRREKTAPSLTETGCAPRGNMKTRGLAFMNRNLFESLTRISPVFGPTVKELVRNGPQGPSVLYLISLRNQAPSRRGVLIVQPP